MMETIKETIVVEGKDDEAALKRAVNCEIIITRGFGITEEIFKRIEHAAVTTGVIIFTDPDFAGERIRERISKRVKNCKHAFISKEEAMREDNIGVENASPECIVEALKKVRTLKVTGEDHFDLKTLHAFDLAGIEGSAHRRNAVGRILGIGYCNAKQFVRRLNHYGVTREEFAEALAQIENNERGM